MKSNFFKYIFIIFVVGILIFAIVKIKTDEEQKQNVAQETRRQEEKITELHLGIAEFDTINPLLTKNKNVQDITKLIYEPLVNINENYKAVPALAVEWAKQNETTYIIKLRENVKWANGEKFTSEDVEFTIAKLKENNTIYTSNVQDISKVEITDDYTLKIILNKEIPFFEYNLTFPILSKVYYDSQEFSNTTLIPVGTGMYQITNVEQTYLTLTKNSNWWDRNTNLTLDKILVNIYSSAGELYNAFKIGNIDLINTSNTNLQEYIGTIGYTAKEFKGREHDFLVLNTKNYFLSKQEVRRAISYSIDKTNIVSSVFSNKSYTSSFPLDYGSWVYQEQDSSSGYNVEQAKQLLQNSGWVKSQGYWQKTENRKTSRLALNLIVKYTNQAQVAVAENIKAQLQAQGITINIQGYSDARIL